MDNKPTIYNIQSSTIYAGILSGLFILIITLPFLGYLFLPGKAVDTEENRRLTSLPALDITNLDFYPQKFENHYNDHFGFRDELISMNKYIKIKRLGFSPTPSNVYLGKDGWIYLAGESLEYYKNEQPLSAFDLQRIENKLATLNLWCNNRGIKFYLMIAPNKANIYPEYVPNRIKQHYDVTKLQQIKDAVMNNLDIHIIDPYPIFMELKKKYRLYHRTDNHWNQTGVFFAGQHLLDVLRKDFPNIKSLQWNDFQIDTTYTADFKMARMLSKSEEIKEEFITFSPLFKTKAKPGKKRNYSPPPLFNYPYEEVYETKDSSLPNVLIVRDSYTTTLIPFIVEHFNESMFIWDKWEYKIPKDIVEIENPDIVIIIMGERKLPLFINN